MIQHFMEEQITPLFCSKTRPQLYYMGKILPELSSYPRIMHSHPGHVEIVIIYKGTSEYLIRDRKQTIRPGDVIIYNSGTVHDELSSAESQIGSYFFAIGNLQLPGLRPNALLPDEENPVFHIREDFARIIELCEGMLHNLEGVSEWSKYITHFSAQALLEIIWRVIHLGDKEAPAGHASYSIGRKVKEYIDAHYCEAISMKTICADLHLSESYVSHVFKDMLGYSPMQYTLRRKIGEAQTLLISTDHSVAQIAQMVGFSAQSHFNQRFVKYVGISPSKFRKNYRSKTEP